MSERELLEHFAEGPIRLFVVVLHEVLRREIVERFFSPRLSRELVGQLSNDALILRHVAQLPRGHGVEEEGFTLSRGLLDVRPDSIARVARTLQEVVALGKSEVDQLALVTLGQRPERLECRACLRVAFRTEQSLRPAELQPVAVRAGNKRRDWQVLELGAGRDGKIAEREFVHHARVRVGGLFAVARRFCRARQAHQHIVGRGQLGFDESFVDVECCGVIAERLVAVLSRPASETCASRRSSGRGAIQRVPCSTRRKVRVGSAERPVSRESAALSQNPHPLRA